ncbi:hypothetical protein JEQ12_005499 [Ovis aries]|uniref:Uncharacterized protein n=1 Tax=Ovis aries TaxID=9940 RepID=A0A836CX98_SHEEP|nr:hypothetical protein JEQ12_005499 [Ovis aries]
MDRSSSGCLPGLAGRFCRKCKSAEGGVSSWEDSPGAAVGADWVTRHQTKESTPQQNSLAKRTFQGVNRAHLASSGSRLSDLREDWMRTLKHVAATHEKDASPAGFWEYPETRDISNPGQKIVPSQGDSTGKHNPRPNSDILKQILLLPSNQKIYTNNEDDRVKWQEVPWIPHARTQTELKSKAQMDHQNDLLRLQAEMYGSYKNTLQDFPGSPVGKTRPFHCRGLIPGGAANIPHAMSQA